MRIRIFTLLMFLLFSLSSVSAQDKLMKNSPVGKWKFEARDAPVEYSSGIIEFSFTENKYSTAISFTGSDYIIPGDKTKFEKDSVTFTVLVEGDEVTITLKPESDAKMTGKAVYSEGEIPLILTKEVPK